MTMKWTTSILMIFMAESFPLRNLCRTTFPKCFSVTPPESSVFKRNQIEKISTATKCYGNIGRSEDYFELNPIIASVEPSKTIEVHAMTKEMEAKGEVVVSLCVGEPDYEPPREVIEATAQAALLGKTKYTGVAGSIDLREAISNDLSRRKNTHYHPSQIVVSNGAKQCVFQAILSLIRSGDEVVIPSPYWTSYPEIVRIAGGTPIIVDTDISDDFKLSPTALKSALSPRTRMLIFCNPSNPTGAVYSEIECRDIASTLSSHTDSYIWLLADEIYERIVYDTPHFSMAAIEGMDERILLVNGFSKSHAMTGYRIGYLAAPLFVIKAVTTLQGQLTSCASSISQHAALSALLVSEETMQPLLKQMREKRDFVLEELEKIPNVKVSKPEGAFYVLPDISHYYGTVAPDGTKIDGSTDFCLYFLRAHKVALVAGDAFGYSKGVRISYATSVEALATALSEFKRCLQSLV